MSLSNYTNQNGELEFPSITISNNIEFNGNDVRLGNQAGANNQASTAIAIGNNSGQNNQSVGAISIGTLAGVNNQQQDSVAIGFTAGSDNQQKDSVAIGRRAGNDFQGEGSVAIGNEAGDTQQGEYCVAVGYKAGFLAQDNNTIILNATGNPLNSDRLNATFIAPIRNVASSDILYYNSTSKEVSFAPAPALGVPNLESVLGQGNSAGSFDIDMNTNDILNVDNIDVSNINLSTINNSVYPPVVPVPPVPSLSEVLDVSNISNKNIDMSNNDLLKLGNLGFTKSSVSIGNGSGGKNNDDFKVNVGYLCGATSQQSFTVAIGNQSGNNLQKASSVAIGNQAGRFNQGVGCVAIGRGAGDSGQGERAIAIGTQAGFLNQHTQTIILNATDISLNSDVSNAFYVNPIRNGTSSNILYYNTSNKEISFAPAPTLGVPSLGEVLDVSNVANKDINMNSKNLLSVNNINLSTINNSSYPPPPPQRVNYAGSFFDITFSGINPVNFASGNQGGNYSVNGKRVQGTALIAWRRFDGQPTATFGFQASFILPLPCQTSLVQIPNSSDFNRNATIVGNLIISGDGISNFNGILLVDNSVDFPTRAKILFQDETNINRLKRIQNGFPYSNVSTIAFLSITYDYISA
jgi:hypothetical protein